jgi:putative ABC transport system permease protein
MKRWFFYFSKRSLQQRKGRFLISALSVLLTVALFTALIVISTGMRQKMGRQLSAYGANMIVSPEGKESIPFETAEKVATISNGIRDHDYHLYGEISVKGLVVDIIGLDISKAKGFRIQGKIPDRGNEAMIGRRLATFLDLKTGDILVPEGKDIMLEITGVFEKGTDEDSSIIMGLDDARRLTGIEGVSAIMMNVDPSMIDRIGERIRKEFPYLRVKTIRQIALAEESLLRKMQLLMLLVTVVVLFSSAVSLGSTMGANVIERREEIGLMKALGATRKAMRNFFLYEALIEGITGSITGIIIGIIMAEAISLSAFDSYAPVEPLYLLFPFLTGLLLSAMAIYIPVRDAVKTLPSVILRGE